MHRGITTAYQTGIGDLFVAKEITVILRQRY